MLVNENVTVHASSCQDFNPLMPSGTLANRVVKIRCHRMQHLLSACTVCIKYSFCEKYQIRHPLHDKWGHVISKHSY